MAQAAAASAAEVLSAVSWLVEHKRGGPLHAAAQDYNRAARDLHRRTVPASARSRSMRTAAGALVGARLVKRTETRQLLSLLTRLTALSESLARLRETQGRAAQALAARRAAEQLANEQHRRADAASAAVSVAVTLGPANVEPAPPHRVMNGPAPRGASPSR
jgi:chorismate synthase